MAAITLRATKGSPLTNAEVDANFSALNSDVATRLPAASFSSAGIAAQLGFTPYSASNPSNFITAAGSITGNAATATRTALQVATDANVDRGGGLEVVNSSAGATNFPVAAGVMVEARRSSGSASDAGTFQLFSSNDANETFSVRKVTGFASGADTWSSWRTLWHSGNLTNLSQLTNGPGFLSAITGSMVSAALGFTPYSASNPSAFITASSSITGNAATATKLALAANINGVAFDGSADVTVADATKLPLVGGTLTGPLTVPRTARIYGVLGPADTRSTADAPSSLYNGLRLDLKTSTTIGSPAVQSGSGFSTVVAVSAWTDAGAGYPSQISIGDGLAIRQGTSATAWGPWRTMWHSGNLTNVSQLSNDAAYAAPGVAHTWTGTQNFRSDVGSAGTLGSHSTGATMVAYSDDGGAAFLSFLRNGSYAVNMGLDPDNVFRIGGWSAPAGVLALDMSGNLTVLGGIRAATMIALNAALTDTTNGSSWYGIGRASSDLLGGGGNTVQVGGYAGVRIATSGVNFDVTPSAITTSAPMSVGRLVAGYDSGAAGSVNASNWLRATGNTGLYMADTGLGLYSAQGDYGTVGTYGAKGSWAGYSIAGGVVFMHNASSSGQWGIYNDYTNSWILNGNMGGDVTFSGNVTAYSDLRIKKDIEPIRDALKKLLTLTGMTFTRTDTGERGIGLGAQHVQAVFPEAVRQASRDAEDKDQILTVAYGNLIGPVVEALREIDARLAAVEAR